MRGKDLLDKISLADDKYIEEASVYKKKNSGRVFKLAVIAAVAALAVLLPVILITAANKANHGIPTPPDVTETVPVPVTDKDTTEDVPNGNEPVTETAADETTEEQKTPEGDTVEMIDTVEQTDPIEIDTETDKDPQTETVESTTEIYDTAEIITVDTDEYLETDETTTGEHHEAITFVRQENTDRRPRIAEIELSIPEKGYNEETGYAVCIITVMDIDKSGISSSEIGKRVPVEIRIDKVLSKNPAFTLDEGDITAVGEFTAWFKTDEGYLVQFRDDVIPMTEEGAQYIIFMYNAEGSSEREYWNFVDYMAEPLTLPVFDNGTYDKGLYDVMKLADDVRACSEDLIKQFFAAE